MRCSGSGSASTRSQPIQDLIDALTREDSAERLTLQHVLDHPALQRGPVDGAIDRALLFESIKEIR
jgi:hypothetical protein